MIFAYQRIHMPRLNPYSSFYEKRDLTSFYIQGCGIFVQLSVKHKSAIPFLLWLNRIAFLCRRVVQWLVSAYHDNLDMRCEALWLPDCMCLVTYTKPCRPVM